MLQAPSFKLWLLALPLLMGSAFMASAQDVTISTANPGTNNPVDFYVHLDGTPYPDFVEGTDFYIVIADLDGNRSAMGYGGGDGQDIWVTADSFYGIGTLPDGVYQVYVGDWTYACADTFAYYFSVCTALPEFDTVVASDVNTTLSAQSLAANFPDSGLQDALDFNDGTDFNIDVISRGASIAVNATFLNVLPSNDYGLQNFNVASVDYSLDGQDYTGSGVSFDGSSTFDIDLSDAGLGDGPHVIYVRGTDFAGDTVETSYWFAIDNMTPVITWFDSQGNVINPGDTITTPSISVTAGFWSPFGLTGFDPYGDSTVTCYAHNAVTGQYEVITIDTWNTSVATWFYYSGGPEYDWFYLSASVTDINGNLNAVSAYFNCSAAPIVTSVSPVDTQWITTATPQIYAEFSVPAGGTLTNQTLIIDDSTVDSYIDGSRVYASSPNLTEGTHTIAVIAGTYIYDPNTDAYLTYMMADYYTWSFGVDTVAPTLTSLSLNGGYLDAVPADATSGVSFISLDVGGGQFQPYALSGDSIHFDTSTMQPGYYAIKGTIIDVAGNSYRFTSGLTVPEVGNDEELALDDVVQDTTFDIQIWRTFDFGNPTNSPARASKPGENVWIGECVDVEAIFANQEQENDLTGATFQWNVGGSPGAQPGDIFAGYSEFSASAGTVKKIGTNTDEDHLDRAQVVWYWWRKPGVNPVSAYCDVNYSTMHGDPSAQSKRVSTTFTVQAPDCEMKAIYATEPSGRINTCHFPNPDPNKQSPTKVNMLPGGINVEYVYDADRTETPILEFGIFGGDLTLPLVLGSRDNPVGDFLDLGGKRVDLGNESGIRFDAKLSNFNLLTDQYYFMQVVTQEYRSRLSKKTIENGQTPEKVVRISLNTEPEWDTNPGVEGAAYDLDWLFSGERSESHDGYPFLDAKANASTPAYQGIETLTLYPKLATTDRPYRHLNSAKWSDFQNATGFAMYVMYIPKVDDVRTVAVPLNVCKWGFWMEAYQDGCSPDSSTGNGLWIKNLESIFPYMHDPASPAAIPEWFGNSQSINWNGSTITDLLTNWDW